MANNNEENIAAAITYLVAFKIPRKTSIPFANFN